LSVNSATEVTCFQNSLKALESSWLKPAVTATITG